MELGRCGINKVVSSILAFNISYGLPGKLICLFITCAAKKMESNYDMSVSDWSSLVCRGAC